MTGLTSLPNSLRDEIQKAATTVLAPRGSAPAQPVNLTQSILTEIARQSPEQFVALILATMGYTGLVVEEIEETRQDQVVKTGDRGFYHEVQPMVTRRRVRREVRFLSDRPLGLRERK